MSFLASFFNFTIPVYRGFFRRVRTFFYAMTLGGMGKKCGICSHVSFGNAKNIFLGDHVIINEYTVLQACKDARITVGNNVHLSYGAYVLTGGLSRQSDDRIHEHVSQDIVISEEAWIGARAIILPGVTIGFGAVVGAGSVVTKNVEPHTLVAGVPAKLIRNLKCQNDT